MIRTGAPVPATTRTRAAFVLAVAAPVLTAGAVAQKVVANEVSEEAADEVLEGVLAGESLIADALERVGEEVRVYNDHLTILASPWMEGRLPGTRGMELAKEYMEFQFKRSGLVAPLPLEVENADGTQAIQARGSYRQEFSLGASNTVKSAAFRIGDAVEFEHGVAAEFTVTGLGSDGDVEGDAVFVGYAIEDGPDGFTSFAEGVDLTGKVAVLLRFEPMNAEGETLWGRRGWTSRAGFKNKLEAVAERGAVAAVIINTPGASDNRVKQLLSPGRGGNSVVEIPVLHASMEAGEKLVSAGTGGARTLAELRDEANASAMGLALDGTFAIHTEIESVPVVAENVIAMLPGRGRLADQYVVVGAHLDHLGMGEFGSRDRDNRGKLLHPGADDNASGSAGILLIADKMAREYRENEELTDLRSVLFMGFSAEESGLNGSAYYANNPIFPIEKHALMMNFDMIGRIKNKRLSLSGAETGAGMPEFLEPIVAASPLEIVQPERMGGMSDHTSFQRKEIPVLFAIIADFHGDYHTPRDVSSLINRVDAVHAANLFFEIALAAAQRPEAFAYVPPKSRRAQREEQKAKEEAEAAAQP
ncbi:MAG: M28 family peptidase, partial [Planctomycetota bacterium]